MRVNKNSERGFTVLEMSIVLVLVALISAVGIGIVAMTSRIINLSDSTSKYITQLRDTKEDISDWIYSFDISNSLMRVDNGTLSIYNGTNVYIIVFEDDVFTMEYPDNSEETSAKRKQIIYFSFDAECEKNIPGGLISCTLKYGEGSEYTFLCCVRAAAVQNAQSEESSQEESLDSSEASGEISTESSAEVSAASEEISSDDSAMSSS
jgi:prepilin-type N-terminal cleavage/methylation domain-containing protein